jgi:hypothetical protein
VERRITDQPVPEERRRGRKPLEGENMVSANVCLTPRELNAIKRYAAAHGYKLARVLRVLVRRGLNNKNFDSPDISPTM